MLYLKLNSIAHNFPNSQLFCVIFHAALQFSCLFVPCPQFCEDHLELWVWVPLIPLTGRGGRGENFLGIAGQQFQTPFLSFKTFHLYSVGTWFLPFHCWTAALCSTKPGTALEWQKLCTAVWYVHWPLDFISYFKAGASRTFQAFQFLDSASSLILDFILGLHFFPFAVSTWCSFGFCCILRSILSKNRA